jgi:hypothetical protein
MTKLIVGEDEVTAPIQLLNKLPTTGLALTV